MMKQDYARKVREYKTFLKDDQDWDYIYILRLLQYKLKRTRQCIVKNDVIVSAKKVATQIQAVEKLLQRVIRDNNFEEIAKGFHAQHGRLRMRFGKAPKGAPSVPLTLDFKSETKQNSKRLHRQYRRLVDRAERMKIRDLESAFDLMKKNIWGWWD